jgi:hypothetical protein
VVSFRINTKYIKEQMLETQSSISNAAVQLIECSAAPLSGSENWNPVPAPSVVAGSGGGGDKVKLEVR